MYESSERPGRWTNPHQIWYGGLTLKGPGHSLCFGPRGQGGPKQGLESIYSRNRETRQKFYKTKVVGKVCFSGGRSYFWARNPDPEGPGPHVLLEPWSVIFRQSLLNKRCSTLGLTFLATFALTIHLIILI